LGKEARDQFFHCDVMALDLLGRERWSVGVTHVVHGAQEILIKGLSVFEHETQAIELVVYGNELLVLLFGALVDAG
jgi:hypothetical protein